MTKEQLSLLRQYGFSRKAYYAPDQFTKTSYYQRNVKSIFMINCKLIVKHDLIHLQGEDKLTKKTYTINTFEITLHNLIKLT